MLRWVDLFASLALVAVGVLHIVVGGDVFVEPSEQRVWFFSAGVLGITAGLASFARAAAPEPSRLLCLTALTAAGGVAVMGVLLAAAGAIQLRADPGIAVLGVAAVATAFSVVATARSFVATRQINIDTRM